MKKETVSADSKKTIVVTDVNKFVKDLKSATHKAIEEKDFEVTGAQIYDGKCNFTIKVNKGKAIGTHTVKGEGLVDADMEIAFSFLNVHFAILDDIFKHSGIEIESIKKFNNHELSLLYHVTGIKIKGGEENPTITLTATKTVTNGTVSFDSIPVKLIAGSGHEFWKELKKAVEKAVEEVEEYINGKFTPIDHTPPSNKNQTDLLVQAEEFYNAKK